jgi:hypothetical protein
MREEREPGQGQTAARPADANTLGDLGRLEVEEGAEVAHRGDARGAVADALIVGLGVGELGEGDAGAGESEVLLPDALLDAGDAGASAAQARDAGSIGRAGSALQRPGTEADAVVPGGLGGGAEGTYRVGVEVDGEAAGTELLEDLPAGGGLGVARADDGAVGEGEDEAAGGTTLDAEVAGMVGGGLDGAEVVAHAERHQSRRVVVDAVAPGIEVMEVVGQACAPGHLADAVAAHQDDARDGGGDVVAGEAARAAEPGDERVDPGLLLGEAGGAEGADDADREGDPVPAAWRVQRVEVGEEGLEEGA